MDVTSTPTEGHGILLLLSVFVHEYIFATKIHSLQYPRPLPFSSLASWHTPAHPVLIFLAFIPIISTISNQYRWAKQPVNNFILIFLFSTFLQEEGFFLCEIRQLFCKQCFEYLNSLNCRRKAQKRRCSNSGTEVRRTSYGPDGGKTQK